jgi:hypothetical protein
LRFGVIVPLAGLMVACSGSTPKNVILQPAVTAAISPTSATLPAAGTQSFSATVQNAADTNVTWYVNQVNGGSSATGTITSTGVYTAPSVQSQTVFTVTAVADADTSISASASVTVTPVVSVTINPHNAAVETSHTQQFSATVVNTTNTAVTWQVNGVNGGSSTTGTINANGLYTAPSTVPSQPNVTVTVVSVADPTKSDSAAVTISLTPVLTVNPLQANVVVTNQQQFTASISGLTNQSVTWSLSGTGCSGAQCGTINSSGLYTAPASVPSPATVKVTDTSQVDNTVAGTATVTVIANLGVSISPPGTQGSPVHVALGATQLFSATVVGDTSNSGVTWDLVCVSDSEVTLPLDCASGKGSSDGENDISQLTSTTLTSTIFQAAVGDVISSVSYCDELTTTCVLKLTATTNAMENGSPATAVVYISVP